VSSLRASFSGKRIGTGWITTVLARLPEIRPEGPAPSPQPKAYARREPREGDMVK
jgi:hypothetical protein